MTDWRKTVDLGNVTPEPNPLLNPLNERPRCKSCKQQIDPDVCHCGDTVEGHGYWAGHTAIPMGCICGYDPAIREQWELDEKFCITEGCIEDPNDGDGYDGYCGNCADRREKGELMQISKLPEWTREQWLETIAALEFQWQQENDRLRERIRVLEAQLYSHKTEAQLRAEQGTFG